ncbi:helix-turn-helix domain-containing protein [Niveibacterium terrae]|uniref:helix-turn-helix domain-containing protein n=1 Tax=Niveibacterium terrae TaxID=3373598 RepID=UPI003A93BCAB
MNPSYVAIENLRQHKARLHARVQLGSGIALASWSNRNAVVRQDYDHHTLSLYIAGGFDAYHKTPRGWHKGGGPDRFCLMPQDIESIWDLRSGLSFVHLYCTDQHLRDIAVQVWDREPAALALDEKTFAEDARIVQLYRNFLLGCDWQQSANHLMLSTTATLLLTHLVQHYSSVRWPVPTVRGGLAPSVLRRIREHIEQHLADALTLEDLAGEAGLSVYHFARMFKQTTGLTPHQYLMRQRMQKAQILLLRGRKPLTEIALQCGFSSPSHFSSSFRAAFGVPPSHRRG